MKIKVDDIELYYEMFGEGKPIIFSHGWMGECSVWNSQIEFFSEKYKVIAYDHRGHGKSDKPKDNYSVETLSNDLDSLIQGLNLEKVTLVGHAMGGMTALTFALNHPEKVSKMVLVGSTAKQSLSMRISLRIMMHIFPYESFIKIGIDHNFSQPAEQTKKEAFNRAIQTPKAVAYECLKESKNYDIRDRVSEIKIPTLIIVGENDKSTPIKMSRYLNGEIVGSKLKIIPQSKHIVMIDRPKELNEIIEEFIR